jgi:lysosomal Pro-X carboxypeptidase
MHYPTSVVGAIAASAPVLAFDGLLTRTYDGNAYWRVVSRDASTDAGSDPGCAPGVHATWPALFSKGSTAEGRTALTTTFKLCAGLQGTDDVSRLASWLLNLWDTLAMGNFPYRSNYLIT